MPNAHLNFFRPYQDETHEDELTRAALVVMRLVPHALAEFLRRIDPGLSIAALPPVAFDTQTTQLHPELSSCLGGGEQLEERQLKVVSAFLTPEVDEVSIDVKPSGRTWRVDGVLRFGDRLAVVLESKLRDGVAPWQAENIPLGDLEPYCDLQPRGAVVRWHDLLESWMRLAERDVLSPAERQIVGDFFDLAGEHFADLLPFNSLARAGDNWTRIQRRLRDLLGDATGAETERDPTFDWWYAYAGWQSFSRIALWANPGDRLRLGLWPAHVKRQAHWLYGGERPVDTLADLDGARLGHARVTWLLTCSSGATRRRSRSLCTSRCPSPTTSRSGASTSTPCTSTPRRSSASASRGWPRMA